MKDCIFTHTTHILGQKLYDESFPYLYLQMNLWAIQVLYYYYFGTGQH